jgi:hypothetical protein
VPKFERLTTTVDAIFVTQDNIDEVKEWLTPRLAPSIEYVLDPDEAIRVLDDRIEFDVVTMDGAEDTYTVMFGQWLLCEIGDCFYAMNDGALNYSHRLYDPYGSITPGHHPDCIRATSPGGRLPQHCPFCKVAQAVEARYTNNTDKE